MVIARERSEGTVLLSGFGRPFGLCLDGAGRLLVTDMDLHRVFRFSIGYESFEALGGESDAWTPPRPVEKGVARRAPPENPGRFNGPHSVAELGEGRLLILTYYSPALWLTDGDGRPAGRIGERLLAGPATATRSGDGRILVAEYARNGVLAFDFSGKFLGGLGGGASEFRNAFDFPAGRRPGFFDRPHMCRQLACGDLVTADTWNHRLQRFSSSGRPLAWLGAGSDGWTERPALARKSDAPGAFNGPTAVAETLDGGLLVADWGNNRIQLFDVDGMFCRTERGPGLDHPYDVLPLAGGAVIADSHNGRILLVGG